MSRTSLIRVGAALLALLVLADLLVQKKAHFALEGAFGFSAWFGLVAAVGFIGLARGIGALLQRRDTYYDD